MATAAQRDELLEQAKAHYAADMLLSRFIYDADTGALIWKHSDNQRSAWNGKFAGKAAGYIRNDGYRIINLAGSYLYAHRIIWAMTMGEWPDQIDHINGDRSDNRLENLRSVSATENNRNLRRRAKSVSGRTGVFWDSVNNRWGASIQVDGRSIWLGRFNTVSEAGAARSAAEARYGFHQNHGRAA